ncbi:MAG TPA: hypothetical protein VMQ50_05190 [Casimicrobiaceae bacterium]|nr:hypothetical protein [Casimicrobiaceae bacterium]
MSRRHRRGAAGPFVVALLAGCATSPPPAAEPVVPAPQPPVQAKAEPAPVTPIPVPPVVIVQSPPQTQTQIVVPPVNEEDQQALALLADLQRYATDNGDDVKRELASANQAFNRTRSDVSRIRLAVLLTLPAAGSPDDARALSLLEPMVGKGAGSSSSLKQIATVVYAQIAERTRSVRDEQRKTAAAQEKLDALRAVERSLLLERSRNAGGAGGGGGGGGTGR